MWIWLVALLALIVDLVLLIRDRSDG